MTQKVDMNDDVLGFFHGWIQEFSKHCEKITVICLQKGEYDLPENVKVFSLGKEDGSSRLKYILNFYKYIWSERKNYDSVFVHMNPAYVVLGGLFWKLNSKKVALWYTHKGVDLKLKIAEKFVDNIFTAAKESFRLETKKLSVVGHGIDIDNFKCVNKKNDVGSITILSVGRITKIKNPEVLIEACRILKNKWDRSFKVIFVGSPVVDIDRHYFEGLKKKVLEYGLENDVVFKGSIPNTKIRDLYCESDITVNMTPTGGVDKVVLESMAARVPVLVSNRAFENYFGKYQDRLIFKEGDAKDLATKIMELIADNNFTSIKEYMFDTVNMVGSRKILINKIVSIYNEASK